MASINTRVVRQSAALFALRGEALAAAAARDPALAAALPAPLRGGLAAAAYSYAPAGPPFEYRERALARSWFSALLATIFGRIVAVALMPPLAGLVRRFLPAPGQGPSDAAVARNSFRLFFVGEPAAAAGGGTAAAPPAVVTCVSGPDPYLATAHSLVETGILLAEAARDGSADRLPAAAFGFGFLTPATALGLRLQERLTEAGCLRFEELASGAEAEAAVAAARAPRARRGEARD